MKYFTDPNAIEPPDMELLFPFVDSALPLAYGVLGILLFHVSVISFSDFGLIHVFHLKKKNYSIALYNIFGFEVIHE